MRAVVLFAALAAMSAAQAAAAPGAPAAGPDDAAATALLDKIAKTADPAARKATIAELDKLAPRAIDTLGTYLARPHEAPIADRRKVLEAIKAAVPDKNGRFAVPERKSDKEEKADDDLDWLAGLLGQPDSPALGEVIADDVAIRELAATKDIHAGQLIFDAAFGADTMIYRDEMGRYLRKMAPYSIPALIHESQASADRKRYATYQLERLDRQEPFKALGSASGDEALTIAILDVFRATHHREAVHAVWSKVNSDSPRVRAKAREAWLAYITGPAPPPAPRKKLQLPGGKLTKKEKPLWLTYRELADNELRKAANELLGEDYPLEDPTLDDSDADDRHHKSKTVKVDLEDLTKRLFDFYDQQRTKREGEQWAAAKALADKGDLAGATAALDRMLAQNPDRAERTQMAAIYLARGKDLEKAQKWGEAAAAYSSAQGLDPTGANAVAALASEHFTQGKALEAQGKDGGPDYRKAVALRPDYAPAKAEAKRIAVAARPVWMLYIAVFAGLVALGLAGTAMLKRRA